MNLPMLTPDQINTIHRLHWAEQWPVRKIARHLHIGRRTVAKYLATPAPPPSHRDRTSKLDSFKPAITELLDKDPTATSAVIAQRLRQLGYQGGITILKEYLHAVCLVESHSRKIYLEFTHSQNFETFARCHIHAFQYLGGVSQEIWFDNLATAVAEHEGNLVRFHPRFLAFAREFNFIPRACHVAAAWEKGKVERAIGYIRQNFWPLRSFADLS